MPIGRLIQEQNPEIQALRERLIQEWSEPSIASQPVLIEEAGDRMSNSKQVYVIWDEWQPLDQRVRSEIIMDAYEATHGRQEVLSITVAMGLTAADAERIGLRYETEAIN